MSVDLVGVLVATAMDYLVHWLLMATIVATIIVNLCRSRVRWPRRRRWYDRWTAWIQFLPLLIVIHLSPSYLKPEGKGYFAVATLAGLGYVYRVILKRPFNDAECLENYIHDPGRCGRCEYELWGNGSGVCPECGWQVPRSRPEVPVEVRDTLK